MSALKEARHSSGAIFLFHFRRSATPVSDSSGAWATDASYSGGMRIFWPGQIRLASLITSRLASKIFGYLLASL